MINKKKCLFCNKSFTDFSVNKVKKYCNSKCLSRGRRILPISVIRKCINCNKEFIDTSYSKTKKYRKTNRFLISHKTYQALRRSIKLKAVPKWANLEKIKEIYKSCPKDYHVDHFIPLQSKIVCGLHVENNLEYLKAKDNIAKGNRLVQNY